MLTPVAPGETFGPFVATMRRLQDLAVSVDAPDRILESAMAHANSMIEVLEPYEAPEGVGPAGRAHELPGRGLLLLPDWNIERVTAGGIQMSGVLRRYHLGLFGIAHGGIIPLMFDEYLAAALSTSGYPPHRTAYLNVNFRRPAPIGAQLKVDATVDRVEGRKCWGSARLTDSDGILLAEADALFISLVPK
ncbi:PaaI family thioesterase [Nocardia heshunensis]